MLHKCPACEKLQATSHRITTEDEVTTEWYHCFCDTLFHVKHVDKKAFDEEYAKEWSKKKGVKERMAYLASVYVPLIEEVTYGRRFLDVGFTGCELIKTMANRGWIASGIDVIPNAYCTGDFMDYDFSEKFDMVHFGHVLEAFDDPMKALEKAYGIMNKLGCLLLTHPCPESVRFAGVRNFGHWNHTHSWVYFSRDMLRRMAVKAGFTVMLDRLNISQRFMASNDTHMVLVKE